MAFEIACENAADVTPDCSAKACLFAMGELPDRLIEAIWFGDDFIVVEMFGERRVFDFYVERTGVSNAPR